MDGEEILHQLIGGLFIPLFCLGFNHPKLVVQDFATIHSIMIYHDDMMVKSG